MAPLLVWTAVLVAFASLGSVSAMPMMTEGDRVQLPAGFIEWYLQRRNSDPQLQQMQQQVQPMQQMDTESMGQPQQLQQIAQWLDSQLARAQMPVPTQSKRGNYMALCHFKICNMGRKRSARVAEPATEDLP